MNSIFFSRGSLTVTRWTMRRFERIGQKRNMGSDHHHHEMDNKPEPPRDENYPFRTDLKAKKISTALGAIFWFYLFYSFKEHGLQMIVYLIF